MEGGDLSRLYSWFFNLPTRKELKQDIQQIKEQVDRHDGSFRATTDVLSKMMFVVKKYKLSGKLMRQIQGLQNDFLAKMDETYESARDCGDATTADMVMQQKKRIERIFGRIEDDKEYTARGERGW
eukprot:CAMPEP_0197417944 /NCGR_PEP_ID=MMETSP1170-20131217/3831_1 /TAXON_ID=54406 /ORGANISM="Sarcinochrysis sp, Strain CCMP770" /LENGTH=125 /DNA_ID=CAMNT_0042944949 /DNA_START=185 /DNA_END=559 /DNA_ORIENTATION=+